MRFLWALLIFGFAQGQTGLKDLLQQERDCEELACKAKMAIAISEWYNNQDMIPRAQEWLDYAKARNLQHPSAETQMHIFSMQAELFYYTGLYQFGVHEAQKELQQATKLNDSAFIADALFFKAINLFEMGEFPASELALWKSLKSIAVPTTQFPRSTINHAYLYNNLAQVKIKRNEPDSALHYNRLAYRNAISSKTWRAKANAEQLFGEMYAAKNDVDSSRYYFQESVTTAKQTGHYDVALISLGSLMRSFTNQPQAMEYYRQGNQLLKSREVNNLYKRLFWEMCLETFRSREQTDSVVAIQSRLLGLNDKTNAIANLYVQRIGEKYIHNENRLLQAKIDELGHQRETTFLQLLASVFGILILLFVVILFRRKNRLQRLLLEQKNELSKDLHDDIGSELSSIMINTDLLHASIADDEKRKMLRKITNTTAEISQRLNAFIWSLDNENDSAANFVEYVRYYVAKWLEGTDMTIEISSDTDSVSDKSLNGYFRKNLFFCVKEALHNAIKHASATKIEISISGREKEFQIVVRDNGVGFETTHQFGNGIRNIRKRIAALDGRVRFVNDKGTFIRITVPFPQN